MNLRLVAPIAIAALIALKMMLHWEVDATFIAGIAFFLFLGLVVELKVPAMVENMLDERSAEIGKELAEAKRLREQAGALLAEYEAKKAAAESQAVEIVKQAQVQAEALAAESKANLADMLARHERGAAEKIARAEAQAVADVRAAAIEAAAQAAERLLKSELNPAAQAKLTERGVADLERIFGR